MKKKDESKLPLWAKEELKELRRQIVSVTGELERMGKSHAVLHEREWFTLQGPPSTTVFPNDTRHLWYLCHDKPLAVCSLGIGDILLVGRKKK